MSRFSDENEEGIPWEMWNQIVSTALGGKAGQAVLADLETALLALPEPKLIEGHLASDGAVCAVGAYIAHRQAVEKGAEIAVVIAGMTREAECWCGRERGAHGPACGGKRWNDTPCNCTEYDEAADDESINDTAQAGKEAGLSLTIAWHLAFLNDETFGTVTPEERYAKVLAWTRRALGKEAVAA